MPSETLVDLCGTFANAIERKNRPKAWTTLDEIETELDRIRPTETALRKRTIHARDEAPQSTADRDLLDRLLRAAVGVELQRGSLLTMGTMSFVTPEGVDDSVLASNAHDLVEQEQAYGRLADEAAAVLESTTLPPTLTTTVTADDGPLPTGTTTTVDTVVYNVGDQPIHGVTASVGGDLTASPSTNDVGGVPAGEHTTVSFDVTPTRTGTHTVTVVVEAESVDRSTAEDELTVLDKGGLIERARRRLGELRDSLGSAGLGAGTRRGVASKLERADAKLEEAAEAARRGGADRANDAIDAAINVLGAALNQIHGSSDRRQSGSESSVPGKGPHVLVGTIERIVDLLAAARKAAV